MSFSFTGSTSATPVSSTSTVINVPSGVQDGDFLVLVAVTWTSSGGFTLPAGFTQLYDQALSAASTHQFALGWRVASSEPASYTVTSASNAWPSVIMHAVRGGAAISPVLGNALATQAAYNTALPPPSYSEQQSTSLLIYGYGGINSPASGGGGLSLPSPANLLSGSSTGDVNNSTGGADYGVIACTSSSAPGSATITTGVDEANFTIELAAGGVSHTATAALTVTPSFSAARTRGKHRTGALTVTPSFSAARTRRKYLTSSVPGKAVPGFVPGRLTDVSTVSGTTATPAVLSAAAAFPPVTVQTLKQGKATAAVTQPYSATCAVTQPYSATAGVS